LRPVRNGRSPTAEKRETSVPHRGGLDSALIAEDIFQNRTRLAREARGVEMLKLDPVDRPLQVGRRLTYKELTGKASHT